MKTTSTKSLFMLLAMAAFSVVSCEKNMKESPDLAPELEQVTIKADLSTATKTTLVEGYKVNWEATDEVAVVAYSADAASYQTVTPVGVKTSADNLASADITFTSITGFTPKYIVYPAAACTEVTANEDKSATISFTVQPSLNAAVGTFPSGSNLSVGEVTPEGTALMKNLMGLIKFEIASSDILSVVLSGVNEEKIAGIMTVDPVTLTVTPAADATSNIRLANADNTALAAGVYYIPVVPTLFAGGVKMTVTNTDGISTAKTWKTQNGYQLLRNKIATLGKDTDWGLVFTAAKERKTFTMQFKEVVPGDNTTYNVWPFTPAAPVQGDWTDGKRTEPFGPYYLPDDTEQKYPFYYLKQEFLKVFDGQKQGLDFGGQLNNYFLFPPVEGMKLISVKVANTYGQKAGLAVTNNVTDAEGNPTITVGAYQEIAKKGEYTWSVAAGTLGATQANTAYRLNLSAPVTTYTAMGILELVYEQE